MASVVIAALVHPTRLRKARRVTCGRRGLGRGSVVAIGLSFHLGTFRSKDKTSKPGATGAAGYKRGERLTRRRQRQGADRECAGGAGGGPPAWRAAATSAVARCAGKAWAPWASA